MFKKNVLNLESSSLKTAQCFKPVRPGRGGGGGGGRGPVPISTSENVLDI